MNEFAVVPSRGTGFVELSRTSTGSRRFEKHILSLGPLLYPGIRGGKVMIDDKFLDTVIKNFNNKVCDIVQTPVAGSKNEHTEDPFRNIGEVVGLTKRDGKLYAIMDARDEVAAAKLGKTLLGASALLGLDYVDTRTNLPAGPTLVHMAITNRPYVVGLEEFTELLAASADGMSDAVILTAPHKEKTPMDLDDYITGLRDDHGIDVTALQATAASAAETVSLSNELLPLVSDSGFLALSNGATATAADIVTAVSQVIEKNVSLSNEIKDLELSNATVLATAEVDALVASGHILPKDKEAMQELRLSNESLFRKLVPVKPLVALSNSSEVGFEPVEETADEVVQAEIARLAANPAVATYGH